MKVRRRLGVFFLIMALLALVEWFLALSFFHLDLPPIIGLVVLACPGNGFAAYCTPLGLFAFAVSAGAVVTAVLAARPRNS